MAYNEEGFLSDDGRRKFLKNRQERKRGTLPHPYLGEKPGWGMIPYVQALQSPPRGGVDRNGDLLQAL